MAKNKENKFNKVKVFEFDTARKWLISALWFKDMHTKYGRVNRTSFYLRGMRSAALNWKGWRMKLVSD